MDASERLEAEMSTMPLDDEAMKLLRRLRPDEALDVLHQAGITSVGGNLAHFVRIKVRQRLGEPDSEDEPEESRKRSEQAKKASAEVAAKVEARVTATAAAEAKQKKEAAAESAAKARDRYEPSGDDDEDSSEDEDFDRVEEETAPPPERGYIDDDPSPEQEDKLAKLKSKAADALDIADIETALLLYTDVIASGGASALMLTKRGELLLKQRRPRAALRDCSNALILNPDLGKAYRVRGITHRKLGHWQDAHQDLKQGQRLDYDEGTAAVQKFVAEKVRIAEEKAARASGKRKRAAPGGAPAGKRPRR